MTVINISPAPNPSHIQEPPHNIEAEKSVLGTILVDNRVFDRIAEFLVAEHFSITEHCLIFDAIKKLIDRGRGADPITLKGFFPGDELGRVGGNQYLLDLAASASARANAEEYGRIVMDLSVRRELININQHSLAEAYEGTVDGMEMIEDIERNLYNLASQEALAEGFNEFSTELKKTLKLVELAHKDGFYGVATGLTDLDKILGGLQKTDLVILAGRPGMGKTALATNIAYTVANAHRLSDGKDGAVVGFFSLEMSSDQLCARILSEQAGINSEKIRTGKLSQSEFSQMVQASQSLSGTPIFIDQSPIINLFTLRTRARRLKRRHGLGLVIIDYLQLLDTDRPSRDGRVQEVSQITRGLKALAKELEVPVLALSQLSRNCEGRDDKRPQLSDLRESGSIEQDADVVMFIYRDEYYLKAASPKRRTDETDGHFAEREVNWEKRLEEVSNQAEIIIGKHRHGRTGTVKVYFDSELTKFNNLAQSSNLL